MERFSRYRTKRTFNPFRSQNTKADAEFPFVPWCDEYNGFDVNQTAETWGRRLLFDYRNSVVRCGLLHECRSSTCHKGFLGKLGFCRLGFWHWWKVPEEEKTWMRCHGRELVPKACIGQHPPFRNMLLTERHRPYFGRVNPGVLCAKKCNHDLSVFVSFPAPTSSSGHTAADVERIAAPMARQINDATH